MNGKSMYLWQISKLLNGDVNSIAQRAKTIGLSTVYIKITDGPYKYNIVNGVDLVPGLVAALKAVNIQPWGWGYVYGEQPENEARIAAERVQSLGLAGFVVDAEAEYKKPGMAGRARTYMTALRQSTTLPIGVTTYRYPTLHRELPWAEFAACDFWQPQVYWVQATNAGAQLRRSVDEYRGMEKNLGIAPKPISPIGAAYSEGGWQPTPAQVEEFGLTALDMGLPGISFWEWAAAARIGLEVTIAGLPWPMTPEPEPEPERVYIEQRVERLEAWAATQGFVP